MEKHSVGCCTSILQDSLVNVQTKQAKSDSTELGLFHVATSLFSSLKCMNRPCLPEAHSVLAKAHQGQCMKSSTMRRGQ